MAAPPARSRTARRTSPRTRPSRRRGSRSRTGPRPCRCRARARDDRLVGDERNTLHLLFADADHRRLLVDWELVARNSLAMFRADCAQHVGDPDFDRLVARLTQRSPEFAAWWPQREVARPLAGHKRIDHPVAGRMLFEYASLGVGDPPELKLIVFTPLAADGTAGKLRDLLG